MESGCGKNYQRRTAGVCARYEESLNRVSGYPKRTQCDECPADKGSGWLQGGRLRWRFCDYLTESLF